MTLTRQPKKSSAGCWTCKRRKVGCDKTLPHCRNCHRSERSCEGYGVRLNWPNEHPDGRRAALPWHGNTRTFLKPNNSQGGYHFLNTTYDDFVLARNMARLSNIPNYSIGPAKSLSYGFEVGSQTKERILLAYYHEVLSRMITTIDDALNGFRNVLLPNALSENFLSCQSLRQAILALSAFHLWGHDSAIQYKVNALRLLNESLTSSGKGETVGQFATCMMLCICDVFDAVDGSWATHLSAARALHSRIQRRNHDSRFLDTWLAYHDILAGFSRGPVGIEKEETLVILPSDSFDNTIIIGSLGCSLQVLNIIQCINNLGRMIAQSRDKILPTEFLSYPEILNRQLETLQQRQEIVEDSTSGRIDAKRVSNTAELYRLGTLIHLHGSIMCTLRDSQVIKDMVARFFNVLTDLGLCTSPWPIFMVACEVTTDAQRIRILDTLDKMREERRIGNVEIMRNIIEALWKQIDLECFDVTKRIDWRQLIDMRQIPTFI